MREDRSMMDLHARYRLYEYDYDTDDENVILDGKRSEESLKNNKFYFEIPLNF